MRFSELLQKTYPQAYNVKWKASYAMRVEETQAEVFEIRDKAVTILQTDGEGVACFSNPNAERVEVIDFEHFVNLFTQSVKAGQGKKCDFILAPADHQDYIILNELSHLRKESLSQFREKNESGGKQEKSFLQLEFTINRLCKSKEIADRIDSTTRKIALFSVRLKKGNGDSKDSTSRSLETFLRPATEQETFIMCNNLPHDFTYVRLFYPNPFRLTEAMQWQNMNVPTFPRIIRVHSWTFVF